MNDRPLPSPTRSDHHLPALDGLRGVAILLVLVHHLFVLKPVTPTETAAAQVAALGMYGVDLFFVLSGFLITGILIDGKGRPNQLWNFYARRVLRIFPLYYLVLAMSFVVLPTAMAAVPAAAEKLGRFAGAAGDWPWYVLYLSNFAVAFAGRWRHGVLDVTWSLAIEEQFYLVWPWVVLALSPRQLRRACVGVVLAALATRVGMWAAGAAPLSIYVLTPCRMDALAIGAYLAARYRDGDYRPEGVRAWAKWMVAVGGAAAVAAAAAGWTDPDTPRVYTIGYTLVGLTAGAALVAAVTSPPGSPTYRVLAGRVLTTFGKYSYAIYLFHLPVRAVIRDMVFGDAQFRRLPGPGLAWQGVFYLVGAAAVLPPAWLSWHLFEKRFLALKRYFPTGPGGRPPARAGDDPAAGVDRLNPLGTLR